MASHHDAGPVTATATATKFGQAVIGPPGAGKTTYCSGMAAFLRARGRACAVVNLDPANDLLPYEADVDVAELVKLAVRLRISVRGCPFPCPSPAHHDGYPMPPPNPPTSPLTAPTARRT